MLQEKFKMNVTFYEEFNVPFKKWDPKDFCKDGVLAVTHDGKMRCGHVYHPLFMECKRSECPSWCYQPTWKDKWLK
jgi:hypothetical protein